MIYFTSYYPVPENLQAERNRDVSYGFPKLKRTNEDMNCLNTNHYEQPPIKRSRICSPHHEVDKRRITQVKFNEFYNTCIYCTHDDRSKAERKETYHN